MDNRILKDIRYFENKPDDYQGKFDGILGNIYINSNDTKYIGQRIARKLNEFGFVSGEFDHIYINLSNKLPENLISETSKFLDKRIKSIDYGVPIAVFNNLSDFEKDKKIKSITFEVLHWVYKNINFKIKIIDKTKDLIDEYNKQLIIRYKTKETNNYLINLSFQIRPNDIISKLIIEYTDKIENSKFQEIIEILDYEDLYPLVHDVIIKDGFIIFQPKKSYHAELVAKKYDNLPKRIEINKMTKKLIHY